VRYLLYSRMRVSRQLLGLFLLGVLALVSGFDGSTSQNTTVAPSSSVTPTPTSEAPPSSSATPSTSSVILPSTSVVQPTGFPTSAGASFIKAVNMTFSVDKEISRQNFFEILVQVSGNTSSIIELNDYQFQFMFGLNSTQTRHYSASIFFRTYNTNHQAQWSYDTLSDNLNKSKSGVSGDFAKYGVTVTAYSNYTLPEGYNILLEEGVVVFTATNDQMTEWRFARLVANISGLTEQHIRTTNFTGPASTDTAGVYAYSCNFHFVNASEQNFVLWESAVKDQKNNRFILDQNVTVISNSRRLYVAPVVVTTSSMPHPTTAPVDPRFKAVNMTFVADRDVTYQNFTTILVTAAGNMRSLVEVNEFYQVSKHFYFAAIYFREINTFSDAAVDELYQNVDASNKGQPNALTSGGFSSINVTLYTLPPHYNHLHEESVVEFTAQNDQMTEMRFARLVANVTGLDESEVEIITFNGPTTHVNHTGVFFYSCTFHFSRKHDDERNLFNVWETTVSEGSASLKWNLFVAQNVSITSEYRRPYVAPQPSTSAAPVPTTTIDQTHFMAVNLTFNSVRDVKSKNVSDVIVAASGGVDYLVELNELKFIRQYTNYLGPNNTLPVKVKEFMAVIYFREINIFSVDAEASLRANAALSKAG